MIDMNTLVRILYTARKNGVWKTRYSTPESNTRHHLSGIISSLFIFIYINIVYRLDYVKNSILHNNEMNITLIIMFSSVTLGAIAYALSYKYYNRDRILHIYSKRAALNPLKAKLLFYLFFLLYIIMLLLCGILCIDAVW